MRLKIGQKPDHGFEEPLGLLSDCHRRIEYFLQLMAATTRQLAGASLNAAQRAGLDSARKYFATAAPRHTADEEHSLFPRLRQSSDPDAARALQAVERLERDHEVAAKHHAVVDVLVGRWLDDNRLTADDVGALSEHLSALSGIYEQHIAIEDGDVFPTAARVLSTEAIGEIGREMASRRTRRD